MTKVLQRIALFALFIPSTFNIYSQNIGDKYVEAKTLIDEGNDLHEKEKYDDAINKFLLVDKSDSAYSLAQYELTYSYNSAKQYDKTIEICKRGIERKDKFYCDFIINYSTALDKSGAHDSAILLLDNALKQFPYFHRFYHEKGNIYSRNKQYKEAIDAYTEAIKINPYYSSSHLRIGVLAAEAQKPTLALMALQTYCMVNNDASNLLGVIEFMEKISNNEYTSELTIGDDVFNFANELEEVDMIIRSKAAISNKYKKKVDLNYYIVKQLQVLCEKLPNNSDNQNSLLNFYIGFYKNVWNKNMFEGCILYTVQHINADEIKKEVKQNRKKIDDFTSWGNKYINEIRDNKTITKNGKTEKTKFWFDDNGYVDAIGEINASNNNDGDWIYYTKATFISAYGKFINGKKDGKWIYNYPNGSLKSIENFVDDKLEGDYISYYENGAIYEKATYKNGEANGEATIFRPNTSIDYTMNFKNGKRNGTKTIYSDFNLKETQYDEIDGIPNGKYLTFYNNGAKNSECNLKANKFDGPANFYYENGVLKTKGQFVNGERNGEWIWYFDDGKTQKTGSYNAGKQVGIWKTYYENGKLNVEDPFANNNFNGVTKLYDEDGTLLTEITNKDDKITEYKYFDKSGKVIQQAKVSSSKILIKRFNTDRILTEEGYQEKGLNQGIWKSYFLNGEVENEVNYEKGKKNGIEKNYYKNGKLFYELNYVNGNREGFYRAYFKNKNIKAEGYYKNNERIGVWNFYTGNGKIDTREYYYDGDLTGFSEQFSNAGTPDGVFDYTYGFFNNYTQTDSLGNITNKTKLKNGNGMYELYVNKKRVLKTKYIYGKKDSVLTYYFTNGKIRITETYKYGEKNGAYKSYYTNGKLKSEGNYLNGKEDSIWNYYYENGALHYTVSSKNDNFEGIYKAYYGNGKPEHVRNYKNGEKDGELFFYNPEGALLIKTLYKNGVFKAYTYLDKNNNFVPYIDVINETANVKTYFPNGNLAVSYSIEKGFIQGKYECYFLNGKLFNVDNYVDYENEGECKEYYINGNTKIVENYLYDKRNGLTTEYYENGKIKRQSNYLFGQLHGLRTEYDMTGKLIKKTNYLYDYAVD